MTVNKRLSQGAEIRCKKCDSTKFETNMLNFHVHRMHTRIHKPPEQLHRPNLYSLAGSIQ